MDFLKSAQSEEDEQVVVVPNQRHDDSEPSDVSSTDVMIYTVCNHKYLCQTSSFCHILGLPIFGSPPRNTSLDSDKGENTTEIRQFYTSAANHRLPNTNCFQTDMSPFEFRQLKLVSKDMKYLVEHAGYR
uniref:Uncharacterized protein n=1 Tax=Heterorhabditis bacteriophora TaxID=37862 RepID=A0A1I7WVZ5_HETBA